MTDRAAKLRAFYARYVTRQGGAHDPGVEAAFAAVPREAFVGPAPWFVYAASANVPVPAYVETPDDDPAFLYADVLIALDPKRGVNNGEPSLHARCLDALALRPGETVLHVGAGTGYYTALLNRLVAPSGTVHAFEVDPDLAERARATSQGSTASPSMHAPASAKGYPQRMRSTSTQASAPQAGLGLMHSGLAADCFFRCSRSAATAACFS